MQQPRFRTRVFTLAGSLALILAVDGAVVRPWYLQWGATRDEQQRTLPGDDIVQPAAGQGTRAITIHAPVEQVWPWVAQLGQDRGSFYSFDLLENLVGCEMPTDNRLRPDRQGWRIGDRLWMYPRTKAGGAGFATLRVYAPGRALGFATRMVFTPLTAPENGSWSFVLEPIDSSTTRLIVRGRGAVGRTWGEAAFDRAIFEPMHFVMERQMLIGIKNLAEGRERDRTVNHVQIVLWTLTFGAFIASIVIVLIGRRWNLAVAGVFACAGVFQVLTFLQPPVLASEVLAALAITVVVWPASDPALIARGGRHAAQHP